MGLPKIYDWHKIRGSLKFLSEKLPGVFPDLVLIGGGACWFYRAILALAKDRDYPAPDLSAEDETIWLSKDIDFMGLRAGEAEALLESTFNPETHTINYHGLELDFLDEGLKLTQQLVTQSAREVRSTDLVFSVVEASLLYAEKCALMQLKDRPQDRLHHQLLERFLRYEFCHEIEHPDKLDARDWVQRARTVKTADDRFFDRDPVFVARANRSLKSLTTSEHARVVHWGKHHLPSDEQHNP